jgi:low affinity Fe/Cu permease
MKIADKFAAVSRKATEVTGSWQATIIAIAAVVIWAATGPLFGYSDTWQLYANTGTTLATFIMVFLIQASQNRQEKAVQLKLSEIICALEKADDRLIDIEDATDEQIDDARKHIGDNKSDSDDLDLRHL